MINDYWIIEADNLEELVKLVKQSIDKGWQPLDGVRVTTWSTPPRHGVAGTERLYVQTLVIAKGKQYA